MLLTGHSPLAYFQYRSNNVISRIRKYLFQLHLRQYNRLDLSNKGKAPLTAGILTTFKYKSKSFSGIHFRWLTWLLTGHSPIAYFQYRSNNFISPDCTHCPGEEETSLHFLGECVGYMTIRLRTFGKLRLTMEDITTTDLNRVPSYIRDTGRFEGDDLFG